MRHAIAPLLATVLAAALFAPTATLRAQVPDPAPAPAQPFAPGVTYDARIPTIEQVAGHVFGAEVSAHADVVKYLHALAAASPRIKLVEFGKSWEGRALWYAIVGSEQNLARLPAIQQ